jgi:hypothetical protein
VEWKHVPGGSKLALRGRQGILHTQPVSGDGSMAIEPDLLEDDRFWAEVFGEDGSLLALTNPVYVILDPVQ